MSDLDVVLAALERAETEMRYAGWDVFQPDNVGRMDAMRAVQDAIAILTAEPDREEPTTFDRVQTVTDYDPKGLHITHTPAPQLATDCTRIMREQGKPYPRTCPRCTLGPCAYSPTITVADQQGEPVARVIGYYAGRCVIEPLDGKSVFQTGMAVYTRGVRELSDEEIDKIKSDIGWLPARMWTATFARAIIAAAREKK